MSEVFAVIVTYNPVLENVKRLFERLRESEVFVIVIDNSNPEVDLSLPEGCVVRRLGENLGIATAQNIGIKTALNMGARKIVFFDQDTRLSTDFIKNILKTFNDFSVKIAAPVFYDNEKTFGYKLVDIGRFGFRKKISPETMSSEIDISVAISSGTVVDVDVFEKVGYMDESLFIDYVDTEWCLRCFSHGIKVRVNPRAVMHHSIGDNSISFLGFNIPVHSPVRRYYRVRNSPVYNSLYAE